MRRYHSHPGTGELTDRPLVSVGGGSKGPRPVARLSAQKSGGEKAAGRISVLIAYHPGHEAERLATLLDPDVYAVTTCKDGLEALNHISRGDFDVVVTGVKMPHVDGLEVISILRNHDRGIPVIAVGESGDGMDQIFLRSAALFGAFGVLAQPVQAHELQEMVRLASQIPSGR